VRAVNAAFVAEAAWSSTPGGGRAYPAENRQVWHLEFAAELQKAAEWLVVRKVLPEAVTVADHLARL
jgi:sulfonate transport system substrate-binding protein